MTQNEHDYWLLVNERLHIMDKFENGTATFDDVLRLTIVDALIKMLKKLI